MEIAYSHISDIPTQCILTTHTHTLHFCLTALLSHSYSRVARDSVHFPQLYHSVLGHDPPKEMNKINKNK